ncbi:putative disease resistance RPP13-like protein 1 [Glycine max]|uniref:Putative disease resistance RPP13-like protein 1 n=1 Tax=Glycine soja TaxID=3848 RepID=A0A0B2SNC0_GLYSO|nr:putative disease resistance RPP13-like protein 1 [Glycine max]KHN48136.1 Putative disease resistance RPP13-like protein 1 [Glycine soja]
MNSPNVKWKANLRPTLTRNAILTWKLKMMKQVLDDLEFLESQKGHLGLKECVGSGSGSKGSQKLPSTSLVVETDIYGRDDDKEIVSNWLASDTDTRNQLSILSIVGMGGECKTTLAQHAYNDPRIEGKFDIKVWVCVSDDFDAFNVTRTILEAITKSKDKSGNLEMRCRTLGNLKHLFSLDLSSTAIKKLLDSTCSLYNLQILKLSFCKNLEELPLNLQRLEFGDTKVKKMPMHLGKLKNLQVLSSFYVGTTTEFGIQQLGELNLHGRLSIGELQNIQNPWDALAADLKNKIHLAELELEWNQNSDDLTKERDVFENLHPSKHLKKLSIRNYGDKQFPNIRYCGKLQFDYHLTALEMLTISGHSMEASTLERIGYILSNTSLELLFIDSCPNINISISHCYDFLINLEISNGWPAHNHLKDQKISGCPKFESFPSEGLSAPWVESFHTEELENLISLPERMHFLLPSLDNLQIEDCLS